MPSPALNHRASSEASPISTSVTITVYRMGTSFDLTLRRELITAPTVDSMLLEQDLLYIQISEFSPQTGKQLLEHVRKYDLNEAIKGIIIDERNNSGGAVDGAMQAANIFLDAGKTIGRFKASAVQAATNATSPRTKRRSARRFRSSSSPTAVPPHRRKSSQRRCGTTIGQRW